MRSMFHMRHFWFYILAALCLMPSVGFSQGLSLPIPDRTKEWRRISTDQSSTTDIGFSTLLLEPHGLIRATFRIELSKSEEVAGKPGAKYKTQLLTIQFDSRKKAYRIFETTLQDSSGKVVHSSGPNSAGTWKQIARSAYTFYEAALNLPPIGNWTVASSSDPQATVSDAQVAVRPERFQVGRNTCSLPSYESTLMSRDELAKLTGLAPNAFQLDLERINVVKIKCDSPGLTSESHILILKSVDRAVLLSGGELYSLAKIRN
jgi:hypothetical protein